MSDTPLTDQLDQTLQVEICAAVARKEEFNIIIGETLDKLYKHARELEKENQRLREIIKQHREGVARFLVPWRSSLDQSWLDHFVKECGVEFDAIGFVKATPLDKLNAGGGG